MTEAIGGYFELELQQGEHYHKDAILLNTARNCFEYILLARKYNKVYIPYYTCEVMLQPLKRQGIAYEFYSINEELEPAETKYLLPDEAFLYTNYFGIKQCCVEKLAIIYGSQLIVDNAQAFFSPRIASIDTFYSPRKFFGVPDGGYLYTDCILEQNFPQDKSYGRMQHLLQRIDEGAESGYPFFRDNDDSLDNNPIRKMSKLTQRLLMSLDYKKIEKYRCLNYDILEEKIGSSNLLKIKKRSNDVPMVYPYLSNKSFLKNNLILGKVYVATYWKNVFEWVEKTNVEYFFSENLCPIPVDQRYCDIDMKKIIEMIQIDTQL